MIYINEGDNSLKLPIKNYSISLNTEYVIGLYDPYQNISLTYSLIDSTPNNLNVATFTFSTTMEMTSRHYDITIKKDGVNLHNDIMIYKQTVEEYKYSPLSIVYTTQKIE